MKELKMQWQIDPRLTIDNINKSVRRKLLRRAMTGATKIMRRALKKKAPVRQATGPNAIKGGTLKRSIDSRVYRPKRGEAAIGVIGPLKSVRKKIAGVRQRFNIGTTQGKFTRGKRKGEDRVIRPSKYFHLVSRGTKRAKGNDFAENVMRDNWPKAAALMSGEISAGIMAEMK